MHTWSQGRAFIAPGMSLKVSQSFPMHPPTEERFVGWLQCRSRNEPCKERPGQCLCRAVPSEPKARDKVRVLHLELPVPCVPPLTPADTFALSGPLPALGGGKFKLHKNQLL